MVARGTVVKGGGRVGCWWIWSIQFFGERAFTLRGMNVGVEVE